MKRLILLPVILQLCSMILVINCKANNVPKETYFPQVIIDATWGKEPGQFGVYEPEEGPTLGPQTLIISSNGDIYIEDGENGRIQRFSESGELIATIPLSRLGEGLCVDQTGKIYFYDPTLVPKKIYQYGPKGNMLKESVLWEGVRGSGSIYSDRSGKLFLSYWNDSLKTSLVFQVGTSEIVFSREQQKATLREGFVGSNNVILNQGKIFQNKEGDLHLVDDSSRSVKKFSSYKMNLGQAGFTGVDKEMNIYTLKYDREKNVEVMRKYNPAGDLVAEFTIEKDNYAHATRALVLDENGNIFVMSTSKDGLKIIKWSPVEGGK